MIVTTSWWRASSLCILLACGGGHSLIPDGPPPGNPPVAADAGIDAPLDPATAVTVTVTLDGVPQPGVLVYYQNSYLGPSTELRTDMTGSTIAVAEVPIYDSNSVTVVNPFGPLAVTANAMTDELFTYNSVKPGDHLQLARTTQPPPLVHIAFAAPVDSTPAESAVASYQLHTNCGTADLAVSSDGLTVGGAVALTGCGDTVDMLVESLDGSGQSLGSLYQPDVSVRDGGSVSLAGDYQPSHAKTFSYHTEDVLAPQIEIHARLMTAKGVVYDSPAWTLPVSFMNDLPSLTVMVPSLPSAVSVTESIYQTGQFGLEHTIDWGSDVPKYDLDLDPVGGFLEQYQSAPAVMGFGISYTEFGGEIGPSYMLARVAATQFGGRSWQWHFVSPPATFGGGSQPWPHIPSDHYPYNVQGGNVLDATLVYAPGGYDAIRAQAFSLPSPRAEVTGPSGRMVFEEVRPQ